MFRGCLAVVAGALLGLVWVASAQAHPHVLIDIKVEAVFNDSGEVVGLRELWIFDELYTAFAAGGLDADGDGEADEDKIADLLNANMTSLKDYDYFTSVLLDEEPVTLATAGDASAWVDNNRLRMRFFLPFAEPVDITDKAFRYAVYDPTYYVELLHSGAADAIVLSDAPASCSYALEEPNPNPDTISFAASLDRTETAGDGLGIYFAEWVSVACD